MADKDVGAMMSIIAPLAESFIAVRPNHPRALDEQTLCGKLLCYGVEAVAYDTIRDGVAAAICKAVAVTEGGAGESSIICALGSLYFSGEVRSAFKAMESSN
jgi:dihydrofolate synthase/folylpolyglutamate synthase